MSNQPSLGDVVRRASEEMKSWPTWAQPFRPTPQRPVSDAQSTTAHTTTKDEQHT